MIRVACLRYNLLRCSAVESGDAADGDGEIFFDARLGAVEGHIRWLRGRQRQRKGSPAGSAVVTRQTSVVAKVGHRHLSVREEGPLEQGYHVMYIRMGRAIDEESIGQNHVMLRTDRYSQLPRRSVPNEITS